MSQSPVSDQLLQSDSPSLYTWAFPGSPVRVRLALDVIERLQSDSGQLGLLWGFPAGQTTEIVDFTPLPAGERLSVSEIAGAIPPSRAAEAVGYYRVHRSPFLRLSDDDIDLARMVFPQQHQVVLLIQPSDSGPANATFFFWDDGRMFGDFPFLEFPLDASLLAKTEKQKMEAAAEVSQDSLAGLETDQGNRRKPIGAFKIVRWIVAAAVLVTAGVGAVSGIRVFTGAFGPVKASPAVPTSISAPVPRQIPLGLQAERRNRDLKLTWNRESTAVLSATSGELAIEDGGGTRKIMLDPVSVRTGSILYAPKAEQVQMQLTVIGPRETTSESVIVILPGKGGPRVQTVLRREVIAAHESTANGRTAVARRQRSTKPFIPPDIAHAPRAQSPALPVSEPPALNYRTDAAAPALLGLRPTAPPPQIPQQKAAQSSSAAPKQTANTPQSAPAIVSQQPPMSPALPIYYPPVAESSVSPVYPSSLKNTNLGERLIEIRAFINENGRVVKAEPLVPKVWAPEPIIQAARDAAMLWKFKPARKGTQPISSEIVLRFVFKPKQ